MSETLRAELEDATVTSSLDALMEELETLIENDLAPVAEQIDRMFEGVAGRITDNLIEAASKGRLSVEDIVNEILEDITRLAADELIRAPLEGAIGGILGQRSSVGSSANPLGRSSAQLGNLLQRMLMGGIRNG